MKKKKKHVSDFSTLSIHDMKSKKKSQICFAGIEILNNSQKHNIVHTTCLKACNFNKKRHQHRWFFCEIFEIFKNTFSHGAPPVAASDI